MAERLTITIDGDSSGLQKSLQSAENRLNTFNQRVTNSSRNLTRLMGTMQGMNSSMLQMVSAANTAAASLNRAAMAANRFSANNGIARSVNQAQSSVGALNLSFRNLILTIYSVRTLMFTGQSLFGGVLGSVISVNAAYEKQQILLENISQSHDEAVRKMEGKRATKFIWDMSIKAPFDMDSLQDTFIKLKVNGIDPTNGSMQTLLDTVAAFGGTSNNLKLATLAISQMSAKGVVSMEELRRQLGEQVPTAIRAMAAGLGYIDDIYTQDSAGLRKFFKEIEKGAVDSPKAIAAMMKVFEQEYKGSAERMMNTWDGQMTKMKSEWQKMLIRITESGGSNSLFETLKKEVERFTKFLNSQEGDKFIKDFQNALSGLVKALSATAQFVWKYRNEIILLAKALVGLFVIKQVIALYFGFNAVALGSIKILERIIAVKNGARLVTLLFGVEVRKAAGQLALFNSVGAISRARLLALIGPWAGLAAIIGVVVGVGYAYVKATQVSGKATQESSTKLRESRQRHQELTDAINSTVVASEQDRLQQIRTNEERKKSIALKIKELQVDLERARQEVFKSKRELDQRQKAISQGTNIIASAGSPEAVAGAYMAEPIMDKKARQKLANDRADYTEIARAHNEEVRAWHTANNEIKRLGSMSLALPDTGSSDDDKKTRDPLGDLDGTRSQLVNLMMQVKQAKAELNGTSEAFEDNAEIIELQTRAEVEAYKSQDLLNSAIVHQRAELIKLRPELRLYRKELEQRESLEKIAKDQTLEAAEAMGALDDSYNRINSKLERYEKKLRDQHKEALNSEDVYKRATAEMDVRTAVTEEAIQLYAKEAEAAKNKAIEIEQSLKTEREAREFAYQQELAYLQLLIEDATKYAEIHPLASGKMMQDVANYQRLIAALTRRNQIEKSPFAKWAMEAKDLKGHMDGVLTGALDGFVDQLAQGKFAFKSFAKALLVDLAKIIIRALIAKAILSALGLGGATIGGQTGSEYAAGLSKTTAGWDTNVTLHHTGGIAGNPTGMSKSVSAGMFAFAQRYHTGGFPGLKQNEIPVIVEKGEGIFTKEQMKSMGGTKAPVAPQINIINQTGSQVEQKDAAPRFDGEKFVVDVLLKHSSKPGPVRELLKGKR